MASGISSVLRFFKLKDILGNVNCNESLFIRRYRIRGDDEEWDEVLKKAGSTDIVSIKRCGAIFGNSVQLM